MGGVYQRIHELKLSWMRIVKTTGGMCAVILYIQNDAMHVWREYGGCFSKNTQVEIVKMKLSDVAPHYAFMEEKSSNKWKLKTTQSWDDKDWHRPSQGEVRSTRLGEGLWAFLFDGPLDFTPEVPPLKDHCRGNLILGKNPGFFHLSIDAK